MWIQVRPPSPQSSYPASAGFMDIIWNKVGQSMPGAKAARARVMPRVGKTDGASLLTTWTSQVSVIPCAIQEKGSSEGEDRWHITPSILNWLGSTRTFVDSAADSACFNRSSTPVSLCSAASALDWESYHASWRVVQEMALKLTIPLAIL